MTNRTNAARKTRAARSRKGWFALVGAVLAAAAAHAQSPAPADPGGPSAATLARSGSGHLVVRGSANGHAVRLVVDTACPVTIIDSAVYPTLTLPGAGSPAVGRTIYPASLDHSPATSGSVTDLRVEGTPLGRVYVGMIALDAVLGRGITGRGSPDADGILGTDLLSRHGAVVDLGRSTLSFDASSGQQKALAQRAAREGYTMVAMAPTTGRHLAVPCILSSDPYRLVVDTGSPATVVQRAAISFSNMVPLSRVSYMRTLGGVTSVAWIPLQNWSVGGFFIDSAIVGMGNFRGGVFTDRTSSGGQVAGLFGLEYLTRWRAIIDFGTRSLYLKHSATQARPSLVNTALQNPRPAPISVPAALQQPRQTKGR